MYDLNQIPTVSRFSFRAGAITTILGIDPSLSAGATTTEFYDVTWYATSDNNGRMLVVRRSAYGIEIARSAKNLVDGVFEPWLTQTTLDTGHTAYVIKGEPGKDSTVVGPPSTIPGPPGANHFKGMFVSFAALSLALPPSASAAGDYADVDIIGADVIRYIFDSNDSVWMAQGGVTPGETNASIKSKYELNLDTNAFDDASKTKLDGLGAGGALHNSYTEFTVASYGVKTIFPIDYTVPQITEGTEIFDVALSPANAANRISISMGFCVGGHASYSREVGAAVFIDGAVNAVAAQRFEDENYADERYPQNMFYDFYPGSTDELDITVRMGAAGTYQAFNHGGTAQAELGAARGRCWMRIQEHEA